MRKLPGSGEVKVVFCTTRNELADVEEALAEGADEYIMKPFDSKMIQSKFLQMDLL
jgi:two-component system chemotaxis response regulator CheY